MGLFAGGSDDRRPAAESARRLVAGLGCTPAEVLALAVLVAGAVAVLGVLWLLGRPGPPAGDGSGSPPTAAPGADEPVTGPQLEAEDLVVHVAGEVARPGLHELGAGARVADALEAAGGPTDEAFTAALNLAREVSDGEQLYVPGPEEAAPGGDGAPGQPGGPAGGARNTAPGPSAWRPDGRLDLNRATTDDLEELDGIGEILTECGICLYSFELPAKGWCACHRVSGLACLPVDGIGIQPASPGQPVTCGSGLRQLPTDGTADFRQGQDYAGKVGHEAGDEQQHTGYLPNGLVHQGVVNDSSTVARASKLVERSAVVGDETRTHKGEHECCHGGKRKPIIEAATAKDIQGKYRACDQHF